LYERAAIPPTILAAKKNIEEEILQHGLLYRR
jgi:hypothetical protein